MGLAGPKNRNRISNDPQNTTWANNTSRFGHRILTTQGWTPGSSLGATDAAHAEHYTAASSSHIRVLLKEDTLGLGAKRGSERAENFGLAALESVLGRLNGREEDVKKEQERLDDIEKRGFVARKFGFMNFVSGGFLVGDKIEKKELVVVKVEKKEKDLGTLEEKRKERKRKRDVEEEDEDEDEDEKKTLKRKKKSMNLRAAVAEENEAESKAKAKKDKTKTKNSSSSSASPTLTTSEEPLSDKAKRKAARAEKRARKAERRLKKALKKAAKEKKAAGSDSASSSESEDEDETATSTPATAPTTGTSTPTTAAGLMFSGRHAVRQRYIRQKKMASMDPQAMREIFMIKSTS